MTETNPSVIPPVPEPVDPTISAPSESLEIQDFADPRPAEDPALVPPLVVPSVVVPPPNVPTAVEQLDYDPPARWYWGIAEATMWWFGTLIVHVIGGALVTIALLVAHYTATNPPPFNITDPRKMSILTAGEMTLFVLAAILAVSLRYWGRALRELNFSRPDPRHFLIVLAMTIPLSGCVSLLSVPIRMGWDALGEMWPVLQVLDGLNMMEAVEQMAESTSLSALIFTIAILPAIGEELIFRGAIGRVLIANLGIWGGVLLTSFMFGWMHIHPVHALSVIPLGIAIHLVYLWTRSFWMPILLHFTNNCWAAVAVHFNWTDSIGETPEPTIREVLQLVCAGIAVGALATCLWQSRVRFFRSNGEEFESARFPARVPAIAGIQRQAAPIQLMTLCIAILSAALFHLFIVWSLVT